MKINILQKNMRGGRGRKRKHKFISSEYNATQNNVFEHNMLIKAKLKNIKFHKKISF